MQHKKSTSRILPAIWAVCLLLGQALLPGGLLVEQVTAQPFLAQERFVPGEVLVQFKPAAGDAELADAMRRAGLRLGEAIETPPMRLEGHPGLNLMKTHLPVAEAVRGLENHPAIEFAEPNWIYTHQASSNDPYYTAGYLWGMYGDLTSPANGFGSQAGEAWQAGYTGSKAVYVGIIDEGIQFAHADLTANVWTNPYDPVDGIDNDGNGYVDDVRGWDFYSGDNTVYDGTDDDHGTHVAGTIAATGGNGTGVVGVNWNVTYIAAKFLGSNGGTTSGAIKAIDYFTDLKKRHGLNVVALNNSWGGGGYSQALHDAILRAAKAGILFVAAAGNAGANNDSTANYPSNYDTTKGTSTQAAASYDSVIAVAALDKTGALASWSNYGSKTVDLGAPGVSILSTYPTGTYAYSSGTSMATPHVTGAVALYASTHPGESAAQIKNAILSSVLSTTSISGKTVTGGRLNLSTVITPPQTGVPAAPTGLTASTGLSQVKGTGQVILSWTGSSGAITYSVKRSTTSGTAYTLVASGLSATSYADTVPAADGTTYYYVVSALNSAGESGSSSQASVKPLPTPINLSAKTVSRSQIDLFWTDKSSDEAGFAIERSTDGKTFIQIVEVGSGVTKFSSTGLARNTRYYYRVRAFNSKTPRDYTPYSGSVSALTKR